MAPERRRIRIRLPRGLDLRLRTRFRAQRQWWRRRLRAGSTGPLLFPDVGGGVVAVETLAGGSPAGPRIAILHASSGSGHMAAAKAVAASLAAIEPRATVREVDGLDLQGIHAHIGSQLLELEPYRREAKALAGIGDFGVWDLGGGLGVAYTDFVVDTLPAHDRGVAGSLALLTRTVGNVSGAAVLSALFTAGADILTPVFAGRLVDAIAAGPASSAPIWHHALEAFGVLAALGLTATLLRQGVYFNIIRFTLKMMSEIAARAFCNSNSCVTMRTRHRKMHAHFVRGEYSWVGQDVGLPASRWLNCWS